MKQVVVIPARYESSRFPGKPLAMIAGKPLIQRVWERCIMGIPREMVYVATEDERIQSLCLEIGAQVVMTPKTCLTGTDRLYEANKILKADSVINVQGDEPLIDPNDVALIAKKHLANVDIIWNGMGPLKDEEEFRSPTVPKVVATPEGKLLYMSRGSIPTSKKFAFHGGYKQICVYGFSAKHLEVFGQKGRKTPLEEIEDIEILRFLEMGYEVKMQMLQSPAIAVDIPEDVARVEAALKSLNLR